MIRDRAAIFLTNFLTSIDGHTRVDSNFQTRQLFIRCFSFLPAQERKCRQPRPKKSESDVNFIKFYINFNYFFSISNNVVKYSNNKIKLLAPKLSMKKFGWKIIYNSRYCATMTWILWGNGQVKNFIAINIVVTKTVCWPMFCFKIQLRMRRYRQTVSIPRLILQYIRHLSFVLIYFYKLAAFPVVAARVADSELQSSSIIALSWNRRSKPGMM